jgi:hypothetical protein
MNSDEKFKESLEMGIAAENVAYSYLISKYGFVEDLRQQKHGQFAGPALVGTEGKVILPDFVVYTKFDGAFAIDVKAKSSLYPFKGKKCFTVDRKFEDYQKAVQIKRLDYLALVFFFKGRMHFYKDTDCVGSEFVDNEYGRGMVYYFEYDKTRIRY